MEPIYITEEELEYLTNVPQTVCESVTSYNSQLSFREAAKKGNCITLEEFSRRWEESINRLMPDP